MSHSKIFIFGLIAITLCTFSKAAEPVSAEPFASHSTEIVETEEGKIVTQDKEWNPLLEIPQTELGKEEISIWVQHRNGPIQLKVVIDGQQKEKQWSWHKGKEWKWARLYQGPASGLPGDLVIIRGQKTTPPSTTDVKQVVLDPTGEWTPDVTD